MKTDNYNAPWFWEWFRDGWSAGAIEAAVNDALKAIHRKFLPSDITLSKMSNKQSETLI